MGISPGGRAGGGPGGGTALSHLVGLELVRISLPLRQRWASEAGTFSHRDSLLVRVVMSVAGQETEGWGECTALPAPTYSGEYTEAAAEVSARYLVPALLRSGVTSSTGVGPALASVRGHKMAKAALEAAVLDAELRAEGQSMASFFAGSSKSGLPSRPLVPAGVAVPEDAGTARLLDEIARFVEHGYHRVKLKLVPGRELEQVRAVRERWPSLVLVADANGAYSRVGFEEAVAVLRSLEPFGLACVEQPLGDEDFVGHAELARRVAIPICLDEALTSLPAVMSALRLGACSMVNVKAGRLGGFLEALRAHDACAELGVPAWCGGMVETGIGRAANVALASLPGFCLPGDVSPTGRFFDRDVAGGLPLRPDGMIAVPAGPGLGVEVDGSAVKAFCTWRQWFSASGGGGPGSLRPDEPVQRNG